MVMIDRRRENQGSNYRERAVASNLTSALYPSAVFIGDACWHGGCQTRRCGLASFPLESPRRRSRLENGIDGSMVSSTEPRSWAVTTHDKNAVE